MDWLFVGLYPNAVVYCDNRIDNRGEYHTIGRIYFVPFRVKIYDTSEKYKEVVEQIHAEARQLEAEGRVDFQHGDFILIKKHNI